MRRFVRLCDAVSYERMNLGSGDLKLVYMFTFAIGAGVGYYLYKIFMG